MFLLVKQTKKFLKKLIYLLLLNIEKMNKNKQILKFYIKFIFNQNTRLN